MMQHKMAQIIHTPTYSYFAILVFTTQTLLVAPNLTTTLHNGFTLGLIHRFSIHSPSYSPNGTFIEKIERLVEISDNQLEWIESSLRADGTESGSLMGIRPIVAHDRGVYMVKIGIGKPPTNVHLLLDSGSSLVWTQCAPCVHCFLQDPPMYNPGFSDTYRPLPCTHPFCTGLPCINNMCRFIWRYEDNTYTKGNMAAEKFTFASNAGETDSVGAAFGCSSESSPNMFPSTRAVSGILGIGAGPASFLSQLGSLARGRFSYCLVPMDLPSARVSYLRFGADTEHIKNGQTTPMLHSFDRTHYFVELQDISVDGRRLHLPPGTFARRPDRTGGCLLDSGTSATYLIEIAYTAVYNAIQAFFAGRNFTRVTGARLGLELCYRRRRGFASYPSVEFQLKGLNLRPRPRNVFVMNKESSFFCLYMKKKKSLTVLGSALQQNYRVVYDARRNKITFAEENCAEDQNTAT